MLLVLLFAGALILRVYKLNDFPVGFHNDEVYVAYNSWSILQTGKDTSGKLLPLVVNQWGDFRPAGYHYFTALSFLMFGLSDWATRLPGALFGAVSVLLLWFVAERLWGKRMAWLCGIVLAILPWHIIISRSTSESVLSLAGILLGSLALIHTQRKHGSQVWWLLTVFGFLLSFFTYHAARYAVPVFFLGSSALLWMWKKHRLAATSFVLGIVLSAVSVSLYYFGGSARASQISVFTFPETKLTLEESIREDGNRNVLATRFWHNKLISYATVVIENGLKHVQSDFLVSGKFRPLRYLAGKAALMPIWMYVLFVVGSAVILAGVFTPYRDGTGFTKTHQQSLILLWAAVSSLIPASFTAEDVPNVQRGSLLILFVVISVSFGLNAILERVSKTYRWWIIVGVILLAFYSTGQFFHEYFVHGRTHRPWERNNGEKELVMTVNDYAMRGYDGFVTASADNDEMYYLWYLRVPPRTAQTVGRGERLRMLYPKLDFVSRECATGLPNSIKTIYVTISSCDQPPGTVLEKQILREDGASVFSIYRALLLPQ